MWSDSQIVLNCIKSQRLLPGLYVIAPQRCTYCCHPPTGIIAPLLRIQPICYQGVLYSTEALMSSSPWNYGPKWLTTSSQWLPFQPPPLPPLVLAMAVATEFIPTERPPSDLGLHCVFLLTDTAHLTSCCVSVYMLFIL